MALGGHNRGPGECCCSPSARGITILSRFFVMLVFVFCKLFEHYSQTNFPIIKTKPFQNFDVWWPILGICALHLTHPSATHSNETHTLGNTHTVNTHPEQWAANAAVPREQLRVRCLAQGSQLSRGIEGGENAYYSLPPLTTPATPEIRTHDLGLQVRCSIH